MIPSGLHQYVEMSISYKVHCAEYDELRHGRQANHIHTEHSVYCYHCQMTAFGFDSVLVVISIMRITNLAAKKSRTLHRPAHPLLS